MNLLIITNTTPSWHCSVLVLCGPHVMRLTFCHFIVLNLFPPHYHKNICKVTMRMRFFHHFPFICPLESEQTLIVTRLYHLLRSTLEVTSRVQLKPLYHEEDWTHFTVLPKDDLLSNSMLFNAFSRFLGTWKGFQAFASSNSLKAFENIICPLQTFKNL